VPEADDAPVPEADDAPVPEADDAPVPEADDAPVPEADDAPVPEAVWGVVAPAEAIPTVGSLGADADADAGADAGEVVLVVAVVAVVALVVEKTPDARFPREAPAPDAPLGPLVAGPFDDAPVPRPFDDAPMPGSLTAARLPAGSTSDPTAGARSGTWVLVAFARGRSRPLGATFPDLEGSNAAGLGVSPWWSVLVESTVTSAMSASDTARTPQARDRRARSATACQQRPALVARQPGLAARRLPIPQVRARRARTFHDPTT
jgi:hypothetical protein